MQRRILPKTLVQAMEKETDIPSNSILIAEDSADLSEFVRSLLQKTVETINPDRHYQLKAFSQGKDLYEYVLEAAGQGVFPDLIIMDIRMPPGWDGVKTAKKIAEINKNIQVIFCTAYSDYDLNDFTQELGISDNYLIINKPYDPVVFQLAVTNALRKNDLIFSRNMAMQESVGQVMHDVMNPLTLIAGCEVRLAGLEVPEASRGKLDEICKTLHKNVGRIKDIFRNMRSVLLEEVEMEKMDLSKTVYESVEMIKDHADAESVSISTEILDKIEIVGNHSLLLQVFVNLLKNSIEAIAQDDKKWLRVEMSTLGKFVFVKFIDSGQGIPEEVQAKMFNNLFTTKKDSGGTGLGLAICSKIIETHNGALKVNNSVPNTEFDVVLRLVA